MLIIDYGQITALRAVIHHGSFEAAAVALNVTPSAISQRIKRLEDQLGSVLIIRGSPATATPVGQRLFRHAQEVALLEVSLGDDLKGAQPDDTATPIRVVVNADSLDTWFIDAMALTTGFLFDISTDDEGFSADWLKRGAVMAAVTAHAKPVQGCDCITLGALRYLACASPAFATQHFGDRFDASTASQAPMLKFNKKDDAQNNWLAQELGHAITPPAHLLPSACGFVNAALAGIGWGLNPEGLVRDHIAAGRLVTIGQSPVWDVPLFWQFNRITGQALKPLTNAVKQAAQIWLV